MTADPQVLSEHAQDVALLLKQLANKYRLMILCCLVDKELSVGEINAQINLSQSALSQHLAKLRENKLVSTRRESQTIYYRVESPQLQALLTALYDNYCGEKL
jgi:ArsR family transcriptional regulator